MKQYQHNQKIKNSYYTPDKKYNMVRIARKKNVRRAKKPARKSPAKVSKPLRKAVKAVIRGQAETKHAAFYESFANGSVVPPVVPNGLFSNRGYASQNSIITSNVTDIHQLIPYVLEGTDDWQRIGKRISVQSLVMHGQVRVALPILNPSNPAASPLTNIQVVVYILQHRTLKSYDSLRSLNDFTQLLEVDEGKAVAFRGMTGDDKLPVQSDTYVLHHKKKINLKWAGYAPNSADTAPVNTFSVANSHVWKADYSINLTKYCPKVLMYPDANPGVSPTTYNAPTNSSLFMAIAFINDASPAQAEGTISYTGLEQYYYSRLAYKDM